LQNFDFSRVHEPADYRETLLRLLRFPSIALKSWVYRQYDHQVRVGTVVTPGSDAAVIRIQTGDSWKYLAASVDCNARYVLLDPYRGAKIAVAECARNLAMSGAVPVALTDNLNFGNPHNAEIFWQLQQSVNGLAEACRFFNTPVTGGNVSLYNQSPAGPIDPTPTVGMVGLIPDEKSITTSGFKQAGDAILLLGGWGWEIAGTTYLQEIHGLKRGMPPEIDLEKELALHDAVRALIRLREAKSAHDLSDGGLAVAVAESCLSGTRPWGAEIEISANQRLDVALFNETQSRAVVTVRRENVSGVLMMLEARGVPAQLIGRVTEKDLVIKHGGQASTWTLADLQKSWSDSFGEIMEGA
jgi:phosphoribosylformylglycinamidine synthase